MTSTKLSLLIGIAVIVGIVFLSFYTVSEGESALVLRLGRIVDFEKANQNQLIQLQKPGLHFKIPFLDQVRLFDIRIQELATPASSPLTVMTKEQTYLQVEYFAKWRINDLPKFNMSTGGSPSRAETLLEQRINDIVRAEYGRRTSNQAISDRSSMIAAIRAEANQIGADQGVTVIDIRIQQITLPKDVMDSVFERMRTERKQFAEAKRAEGFEQSEEIRALADQKVTVIKAEAHLQGAAILAKGDQEAAEIYAKTFNQNPKFYAYYRSLEAYEKSFHSKNDILILKPDGQFFNYFHGQK